MKETPSRTPSEIIEAAHLRAAKLADEDAQTAYLHETQGIFYGQLISLLTHAGYPRAYVTEEVSRYMLNEHEQAAPLHRRKAIEVYAGELIYARTETAGKNARNVGLIEEYYDQEARTEREEAERKYR